MFLLLYISSIKLLLIGLSFINFLKYILNCLYVNKPGSKPRVIFLIIL